MARSFALIKYLNKWSPIEVSNKDKGNESVITLGGKRWLYSIYARNQPRIQREGAVSIDGEVQGRGRTLGRRASTIYLIIRGSGTVFCT